LFAVIWGVCAFGIYIYKSKLIIGLNVKADYVIHSEGEPSIEAEKL
jgi:hypothetical protein